VILKPLQGTGDASGVRGPAAHVVRCYSLAVTRSPYASEKRARAKGAKTLFSSGMAAPPATTGALTLSAQDKHRPLSFPVGMAASDNADPLAERSFVGGLAAPVPCQTRLRDESRHPHPAFAHERSTISRHALVRDGAVKEAMRLKPPVSVDPRRARDADFTVKATHPGRHHGGVKSAVSAGTICT